LVLSGALKDIAYGTGRFVAVGYTYGVDIILVSSDGINWTQSYSSTNGYSFNSVAYGNGRFVAVGSGVILTSPDGINWTQSYSSTNVSQLNVVTYGSGKFAAVGSFTDSLSGLSYGTILTSSDGISWTQDYFGAENSYLNGITYGNGQFVVFGYVYNTTTGTQTGIIITSPDGIIWTQSYSSTNVSFINSVACRNGQIVAVGNDYNAYTGYYGVILSSPDGITWTQSYSGVENSYLSYLNGITYGNGQFVAFGYDNNGAHIITSSDGTNWINQQNTNFTVNLMAIACGNGLFVAVGGIAIYTSPDAVNWTQKSYQQTTANLGAVTYGNGRFVSVGYDYNSNVGVSVVSPDGAGWIQSYMGTTNNANYGNTFSSICYGGGQFITVGYYIYDPYNGIPVGTIFNSQDGINWMQSYYGEVNTSLSSITYGNGQFVAVGYVYDTTAYYNFRSMILASSDGFNWTQSNTPTNVDQLNGIAYRSGEFVAVGSAYNSATGIGNSAILTSPDGINWDQRYSSTNTSQISCVAYGNGQFVALGGSTVLISSDGMNWTEQNSGIVRYISAIAYGDGQFVASTIGGPRGQIFTSEAGVNWMQRFFGKGRLTGVGFGNGNFVAVGSGGTILESGNVAPVDPRPVIFVQPTNQIIQPGTSAQFNAVADGFPPLYYQWKFNGNPIAYATNASFTFTNAQWVTAGNYSVTVGNAFGSTNSAIAQLTVYTNLFVGQTNQTPPLAGSPTIPTDANHFKVFSNGNFVSGIALDPNKSTIVLTHGWKESSTAWPLDMANNIQFELGSSTPNIVAWDWTTEATEPLPTAALDTQGQGFVLGGNLTNALGANYSQRIHFICQSLGTLVNARAANFIHANGFSWMNTQMTLCDEAEVAWGLIGNSWQTLTSLLQNDFSPQQDWKHPLPDQCAWADNYITAVGMPHPQAVNVILTNLAPEYSSIQNDLDFYTTAAGIILLKWNNIFVNEITDYHNYSYIWYNNTISQINNPNDPPYLMGFLRSWEGGGYAVRPSANTYFIESKNCPQSFPSYSGYDPAYNLVQINSDQANQYLNGRPQNLISQVGVNLVSSTDNILANNDNQQVQLLNGPTVSASSQITGPAYAMATLIKLFTTSLINGSFANGLVRPMGGPVPLGGSAGNSPAYVWIPVTVPSNALTMSFNFMLQGNGNQDSFQVALNTNNLMTVETVLIQTNVTMNSGMLDVSQFAGQQAELFFGIVGGTSTNASVTVSDISFYIALPPLLQIQMAGTNVVLTWPLSAAGYVLQSANQLTPPIAWITVTNVPEIVNFQYTVTNQISGGSRFYRLAMNSAPTLQAQISGSSFVLSWPASAADYVLETSTNLTAAISWTTVTDTPAIVNLQCLVTNQISGSARFYRLKK